MYYNLFIIKWEKINIIINIPLSLINIKNLEKHQRSIIQRTTNFVIKKIAK